MGKSILDGIPPISFSSFFMSHIDILPLGKKKIEDKKYRLPFLGKHFSKKEDAILHMAYLDKGLYFHLEVSKEVSALEEEHRKGDSLELFIDTRDNKSSSIITKYCHHFVFYPGGLLPKEVTRFRLDDTHKLCDPYELKIKKTLAKSSYTMDILIPEYCLYGYEPNQYKKLGFSFRVNLAGKDPIFFSVSSKDYAIEKSPSLWASLSLTEG